MRLGGGRAKGASAEREVAKLLEPTCGKLKRNLEQVRSGGHDLIGIDWLAIEIKRQETLNVEAWWAQTVSQAKDGQIPVLIYRQSRKPWTVVMQGGLNGRYGLFYPARVSISMWDFLKWLEREIALDNDGRLEQ